MGDDDDEPEFSSAMPLEEGDTFFFQPRPLKNLVLVDEQENLSPIMSCQVSVQPKKVLVRAKQEFWAGSALNLWQITSYLIMILKVPLFSGLLSTLFLFLTDSWFGQWRHTSAVCGLWTRTQVDSEGPSARTGGTHKHRLKDRPTHTLLAVKVMSFFMSLLWIKAEESIYLSDLSTNTESSIFISFFDTSEIFCHF